MLAIIATSFAYQFGWLLDYLSYRGFYYKWRNVIKIVKGDDDDDTSPSKTGIARKWKHDAGIKDGEFWNEYMTVCKDGEAQVYSELKSDLSIVRFTRCGIINFSLLTLAIILYLIRFNFPIYYSVPVLLIGMLIVVLCFNTMQNRWIHWYKKIHKASDLINWKDLKGSTQKEKPATEKK